MKFKAIFAEYGLPIILLVVLLTLLPPLLIPYFGFMGTYITYGVTAIVCGISLWIAKRTKKFVE
jgi:O-antigen/teichoic acid export membrane protein